MAWKNQLKPPHSIVVYANLKNLWMSIYFWWFFTLQKEGPFTKIFKLLMVQKSHSQPPDMYETLQIMGDMYGIFTISTGWVCRMSDPISTNQIAFAGPTCRLLLQDVSFPKDLTRFGSRKVFWGGSVGRGTKKQKQLEFFVASKW